MRIFLLLAAVLAALTPAFAQDGDKNPVQLGPDGKRETAPPEEAADKPAPTPPATVYNNYTVNNPERVREIRNTRTRTIYRPGRSVSDSDIVAVGVDAGFTTHDDAHRIAADEVAKVVDPLKKDLAPISAIVTDQAIFGGGTPAAQKPQPVAPASGVPTNPAPAAGTADKAPKEGKMETVSSLNWLPWVVILIVAVAAFWMMVASSSRNAGGCTTVVTPATPASPGSWLIQATAAAGGQLRANQSSRKVAITVTVAPDGSGTTSIWCGGKKRARTAKPVRSASTPPPPAPPPPATPPPPPAAPAAPAAPSAAGRRARGGGGAPAATP